MNSGPVWAAAPTPSPHLIASGLRSLLAGVPSSSLPRATVEAEDEGHAMVEAADEGSACPVSSHHCGRRLLEFLLHASCVQVIAYVMSVPKHTWEFPILPWVTFTASCDEEEIMKVVLTILTHVPKPDGMKEKDKIDFNILFS
ncbi:hypothetical protein ABZP36_005489 [Zizania latifolia]